MKYNKLALFIFQIINVLNQSLFDSLESIPTASLQSDAITPKEQVTQPILEPRFLQVLL
jgi:hypothetical protein